MRKLHKIIWHGLGASLIWQSPPAAGQTPETVNAFMAMHEHFQRCVFTGMVQGKLPGEVRMALQLVITPNGRVAAAEFAPRSSPDEQDSSFPPVLKLFIDTVMGPDCQPVPVPAGTTSNLSVRLPLVYERKARPRQVLGSGAAVGEEQN